MNRIHLIIVLAIFSFHAVSQKAEDSFQTGMTFQNEKNYATAIERYNKAIKVDSRFYEAIYQRAYCNNRLKNYDQAKSDLLFFS
jgi:tetratricopeptide (TPR) repeat protein